MVVWIGNLVVDWKVRAVSLVPRLPLFLPSICYIIVSSEWAGIPSQKKQLSTYCWFTSLPVCSCVAVARGITNSMNKPHMSLVVNNMVSPLSQVFLQHLPSLLQLQNFPELWLGILDFMDKFLHLDNSDLLVSKSFLLFHTQAGLCNT